MICSSCRRCLLARISKLQPSSIIQTSIRTVATVPATNNAAPSTPPPSTTNSTSAPPNPSLQNQPFSEPFFPNQSQTQPAPKASKPRKLTSSCAGGTSLASINYLKQPPKPLVALEDHEYPEWLWTLLDKKDGSADGGIDVASMTKKQRAKYEKKMAKVRATMEKPVPLHEQSKDLLGPDASALEFSAAQKELTKSMREARRKQIREANFLRSM